MKKLFKIALVGRPNVGKSSLFNCLCKRRIAIVEETEGVTRDRLYAKISFEGRTLELIDTGGIDGQGNIPYFKEVKKQAELAITEADCIVFVVDGHVGITQLDLEISRLLLRSGKNVVMAVNKLDGSSSEDKIHDFYKLGIGQIIAVSAKRNRNLGRLLSACLSFYQPEEKFDENASDKSTTVAIIGRPNVGKSTLMNFLAGEARCVVSSAAGTTRDAVDIRLEWKGNPFTFVDTAGIRKKQKEKDTIEKFASMRTWDAIDRSQVCILMLDSAQGMTHQEKRIAHEIEKRGKGCILFFNKWDMHKGLRMEHASKAVQEQNPFFSHCPIFFGSAMMGRNVDKLFPTIQKVAENLQMRIPTGKLNQFISRAMQLYHPPMILGKRLRIYYLTQVDASPPHFVLFVNRKDLMTDTYKKYLINQFRKTYSFLGCPIQFDLRSKETQMEKKPKKKYFSGHLQTEELIFQEE